RVPAQRAFGRGPVGGNGRLAGRAAGHRHPCRAGAGADPAPAPGARARFAPGPGRADLHERSRRQAPDRPARRARRARFHPPPRRVSDMRGNIAQLMQQAQKMQENLQRAQEELARLEVTGSAGGGMVSVTLTGTKECRKVRIDPSILSDQEMVEDLIAAAFNDASNKVDAESKARMSAATAGLPLPPGMKLPF